MAKGKTQSAPTAPAAAGMSPADLTALIMGIMDARDKARADVAQPLSMVTTAPPAAPKPAAAKAPPKPAPAVKAPTPPAAPKPAAPIKFTARVGDDGAGGRKTYTYVSAYGKSALCIGDPGKWEAIVDWIVANPAEAKRKFRIAHDTATAIADAE